MGTSLRALRALALLAGFHLLAPALLGVLLGACAAAWVWAPAAVAAPVTGLSVLLGIPVVRGALALGGPGHADIAGLPLTAARQPELWCTVRSLAERCGTRAPDAILLTGDANAGVGEDTRFLGLRPGTRRLYIGAPLLTGLTEPQLHAVLAHELAHYGNTDTRLAGITHRGRDSLLRTVETFREREHKRIDKARTRREGHEGREGPDGREKTIAKGRGDDSRTGEETEPETGRAGFTYRLMARPFLAYAGFYLRASHGAARAQELAADRAAARIAGRDATASALRETAVLDAAHDFYMSRYATLGVRAGLLPPRGEVFGGLRHLLTAPGRQDELAALRGEPPAPEPSPYDTHPPLTDRIRLIEALPDERRAAEAGARPALALLREPEHVLAELENAVLTPEAMALERLDWPELTHRAMYALTAEGARPLRDALAAAEVTQAPAGERDAAADLTAFLDSVDDGRLWRIAGHLPKSPEAARATGRAAREFLRPALYAGLRDLTELALAETARARWELSWSEPARLLLPSGDTTEEAVARAVRPAVDDVPDTASLRDLLRTSSPAAPHC
ncbi:M48 family metallopeptidase [Streptomyces huiliensis]|uniref:M48 family metallopeptidase n=1 Tax=Streptomyces huiliensis TaxID=2876027 RepID=UPI001CBC06DB|nr:M48 family metallopeptidase [Streptomyces huiliensis]MBZ4319944.1 M48 family metallopeptidase [Streptomyces huiliensis]